MNVLGLQKFLKDRLPGKSITGDTSKANTFPESGDLYIKNTIIRLEERARLSGSTIITAITVLIQFCDIKTKKELFNSTIEATSVGAVAGNFEALLDAEVYNMSRYISDKLHK